VGDGRVVSGYVIIQPSDYFVSVSFDVESIEGANE
jgi:hypothetical protein